MVLLVPWQIIGRWHPGEGHVAQEVFLTFFRLADNAIATETTWWQSRWNNFANTLGGPEIALIAFGTTFLHQPPSLQSRLAGAIC